MHGWMGKLLYVDLCNSKITQSSIQPYAEKYLGGRGAASRIYWETVSPDVGAFDPENRLIFMTGPLLATGTQGASILSVVGKSPMTLPEGYCYGNIGGFVGAELKKAGFDGVVVTGRAPKPVYLWISDNEVELRDASSLWGKGAYRTGEILQQIHGNRTRYLTTGVAGENLVRSAIVLASHDSASSAGFGAVMGSKNFKAIAIRGTGRPSVADPGKLKEFNRHISSIGPHMDAPAPPQLEGMIHANTFKAIDKGKCYLCGMECLRRLYRFGDKLEGYRKCQSMEYYMPWQFSRDDEPLETFFKAPALANDYSIETWELRNILNWLYACQRSGALTDEEIGLPLSCIGTGEFLEKLLYAIANREGFGNILAEGLVRARDKVSTKSREMFPYNVAPIGVHDIFAPRRLVAQALLYSMEPRIHHTILHEIPLSLMAWDRNQHQPGATPVTTQVFRSIARAFWGSEEAADVSSYKGKALAVKNIQNRTYAKESLSLCDFVWPITNSQKIPGYVGDPDLAAKVFTAVTGVAGEEVDRCAERIANLQRAILLREGRRVPEADFPPEYNFTEPLPTNMEFGIERVPGPGDEPVLVIGNVLDRDKFTAMLQEYYRLRGWDEETGIPLTKTLTGLGLNDVTVPL